MKMMMKRTLFCLIAIWFLASGGFSLAQAEDFPRGEEPLIQPPSEEKERKEARIDSELLEVGPFFGLYTMETFGTSAVFGLRLAYHLTEDIFFEGTFGMTKVDQDAFRRLTGRSLVADEDVTYWSADVGYNLFPGQIFLTRGRTINSTIYVLGGLGQTRLDRRTHFTFNVGTGYKFFITDWLDVRAELRTHAFERDLTGEKELTFNLEATAGVALFF